MTIIAHQYNKVEISQLSEDTIIGGKLIPKGYVNATAMCKTGKKKFNDYTRLNRSKAYVQALSMDTGIPVSILLVEVEGLGVGRDASVQGTWVHFELAISIASWISPEFEVWANKALRAIIQGDYLALTKEAAIAEAELNERWDKIRGAGKDTRNNFTDCLDRYIATCDRSDGYKNNLYTNVSDILNRAIFGKPAKQLCEERRCDRDHLRDTHTEKNLRLIDRVEAHAMKLIDKRGVEPMEAIKEALAFYL